MSKKRDMGFFGFLVPYVLVALVLSVIFFAVFAVIYTVIPFSSAVLKIVAVIISVLVILFTSFAAGKESASVLTGGLTALIYSVIRTLLSMCFGFTPLFSVRTPFILATGFLIGIIGGIFGAGNRSRRRRKYR